MSDKKVIIGRTEHIVIPSEGARSIRVKIDTGADRSSIWASNITMSDDFLRRNQNIIAAQCTERKTLRQAGCAVRTAACR